MPTVPASPTDITPDLLAALLGWGRGCVGSIQCQPAAGQFGKSHQLYHLRIRFKDGGVRLAEQFFLKFGRSVKEVFFYRSIAGQMTVPPLLRCDYAAYAPADDRACLLLEDLSETHTQAEWPLPPTDRQCEQTVRLLARIHALWWQNPRLESEFRPIIPAGRAWRDRRAAAFENLPAFLDFLASRLSPAQRAIYARLLSSPPDRWEIPPFAPHQTLLHGDFHTWNVFYPRDPAGSLRLFDWNMWDIGRPGDDLAYLIAVHWSAERRSRLEGELLGIYHRTLVEAGVTGYAWADFYQDYRASVVRSLFLPAWQWVRGILPGIWWPHLERIFQAFDDLKCSELIP